MRLSSASAWLCIAGLLTGFVFAAPMTYDLQCDAIVDHAKKAAAAFNRGDAVVAETETQQAITAFEEATAMDDSEAQAYVNIAVFYSNIHRYDESLQMYEHALKRVEGDKRARGQIEVSMRRAKFGLYSMHRDQIYANGTGNVHEAYEWGLKQLNVSPYPETTQHQVATMEVMLCETIPERCVDAAKKFRAAALISLQKFIQANTPDSRNLQPHCLHSKLYTGSWRGHKQVIVTDVVEGLYTMVVPAGLTTVLRGRDGVVTFLAPGDCNVLSPASDLYLSLADNLMPDHVNPRTDLHIQGASSLKVLSLVQFAGASFYHWMGEVVPRLAVAKLHLENFSSYTLLVPSQGGKVPSFIVNTLEVLFASWNVNYVPCTAGISLTGGLAYVSWDEQPCPFQEGGSTVPATNNGINVKDKDALSCASLAHPAALRKARALIHEVIPQGPLSMSDPSASPYVLIATRGNDSSSMRHFNETRLIWQISRLIVDMDGTLAESFGVRVFDGSLALPAALALFRGASLVVGAHGGALTNIIACQEGTPLVEIGFTTTGAQHYRHMASALGLPYQLIRVKPDDKGRAIGAPEIEFSENDLYRTVLAQLKKPPSTSPSSP